MSPIVLASQVMGNCHEDYRSFWRALSAETSRAVNAAVKRVPKAYSFFDVDTVSDASSDAVNASIRALIWKYAR